VQQLKTIDMMSDRDNNQQAGLQSAENQQGRTEQFNELSELSLEERMNAADHIGEPMSTVEEAVATGTVRGDEEERVDSEIEEENSDEEIDH
jgi:hypothetical protein